MCGRFVITTPLEAIAALFDAVPANDLPAAENYNVCPTDTIAVVTAGRRLRAMRWGLVPAWYDKPTGGPLLINARAETVATKPAFRAAVRERRCLIPAAGYYEWTSDASGSKFPWYINRADGAALAFAGVWQAWEKGGTALVTCAIVTAAAEGSLAALHTRVPVTVEPADWPLWLGEAGQGAAALMRAPAEGVFAARRVDPAVNSNRATGPQLIEPIAA